MKVLQRSWIVCVFLIFLLSTSCNNTKFSAGGLNKSTKKSQKSAGESIDVNQDKSSSPESLPWDSQGFEVTQSVYTSVAKESIWLVNSDGYVERVDLVDQSRNKSWNGAGSGGHRTFVSEIGLIIGVSDGTIYRVADDVPSNQAQSILKLGDVAASSRVCVASFLVDKQPYIGAVYTANKSGQVKAFVRIPIDHSKPTRVNTAEAEYFYMNRSIGNPGGEMNDGEGEQSFRQSNWGYSCYMDQAKGVLWGGSFAGGGTISGVNVNSGEEVSVSQAENYNARFSAAGNQFDLSSSNQSYAISGGDGLVLSASNGATYTMAYDARYEWIYLSPRGGDIGVIHKDCFKNNSTCGSDKAFQIPIPGAGMIGPLSSLNDGRVVGISRSNIEGEEVAKAGGNGFSQQSSVYILELLDQTNPNSGMKVTKIKDFKGDAYMYTDFTGATQYASTKIKKFDLRKSPSFKVGRPVKASRVKWQTATSDSRWFGLKLAVRCYKAGEQTPAFEEVSDVKDSGEYSFLTIKTCFDQVFDTVEIKIEGESSSVRFFSKSKAFSVSIMQ